MTTHMPPAVAHEPLFPEPQTVECRNCRAVFVSATPWRKECAGCIDTRLGWVDAMPVLPLEGVPLDYWREEVRLHSPALGRLKLICRKRGYSYDATIARLK